MFLFSDLQKIQKEKEVSAQIKQEEIQQAEIQAKIDFNKNLNQEISKTVNVTADSYLVVDFESGEEYFYKNKDKKQPIASITKLATTVVALENFLPDSKIKILKHHLKQTEDNGLVAGEVFPFKTLLGFMMMVSSNDAAFAISSSYENGREGFLNMMNLLANKIGMKSTLFFSESGLDLKASNVAGSYSTVSDIALLVKYFYKNFPEFSKEFSKAEGKFCSENLCHKAYNTNSLFGTTEIKIVQTQIPPYAEKVQNSDESLSQTVEVEKKPNFDFPILFSKTGYTNLAGQALAILTEVEGKKIIVVVLDAKKGNRAHDVKNLTNAVSKYLKQMQK